MKLKEAIEMSEYEALKMRFSDCTDAGDPQAKDILYHKPCWVNHVFNVLRKNLPMPQLDIPIAFRMKQQMLIFYAH